MSKIKSTLRDLNPFRYRVILKDVESREEFAQEVNYLNFSRLRIIGYFMVALSIFVLFTDFVFGEFWATYQITNFMILDLILVVVTIFVIVVTHFFNPKTTNDIQPWHSVVILSYVLFHLLWSTGVSIIESTSNVSLPTFLIGVYSATTIFLLNGRRFLLLLSISLVSLYIGLFLQHVSFNIVVTHFSPVIILVVMAWVMSMALYNTRLKSFLTKREVEIAKKSLDRKVKERTDELNKANIKLIEEIKEREEYEKQLQKEKRRAEEADKLKSVFLANMSHEIRTPLNGILGFGELLQNLELTEQKKEKYLNIINANGQQLLKIIDDIMDISMIESNQLKVNKVSFRLNHVLPDIAVFYKNVLKQENKDHIDLINNGFSDNSNDRVKSDPSRVQQVLNNLLGNAIKFTNEGSIHFGGKVDEGLALIYIEDTGIGVVPEQSELIFQRFRQGEESISRSYGGTGIGLSISKGIIELLNGHIWIDLSYKKGSRFCFTLPTEDFNIPLIGKITKKNFKIFDNQDIFVTGKEQIPENHLTDNIGYYQPDIRKVPIDLFSPESLDFEPRCVIFDLSDNKDLRKVIKNTAEQLPETRIFAVCDDNSLRSDLIDAGCHLVFSVPVNIHLLVLQCNQLFET